MKSSLIFALLGVLGFTEGRPDFYIRTFHGKQCLTNDGFRDGIRPVIADCNQQTLRGQQDQSRVWSYYGYNKVTPTSVFAQLQMKGSGKCLTRINGIPNMYTCQSGVKAQVWHLQLLHDVTRIVDPGTGGCLAAKAEGHEQIFGNGSPMLIEECDSRKNKLFLLANV